MNTGGVVGSNIQIGEHCLPEEQGVVSGAFPNGFGAGQSKPMQFSHYTAVAVRTALTTKCMMRSGDRQAGWTTLMQALDPIFWLHHSNIDRLWVIWVKEDASHTLPPDTAWNKQKFEFFDATGSSKSFVAHVLQTTGPLCDYTYEDTTSPLAAQPAAALPGLLGRFGVHVPGGTEKGSAAAASRKGPARKGALETGGKSHEQSPDCWSE